MSKPTLKSTNAPAAGAATDLVGNTILIAPTDILVTTDVRYQKKSSEELVDLMRSLKRRQIQNVTVKPNTGAKNGDPRFIAVDGRNRTAAMLLAYNGDKMLNIKPDPNVRIRAFVLPAVDGKGNVDALDTFTAAYAANTEVNPMSALDQMHTYNTLRREYKLDDASARKVMGGLSPTWVSIIKRLEKLSPPVLEALEADSIDARTAAEMSSLDNAAQGRILAAMEEAGKARAKAFREAAADPSIAQKAAAAKAQAAAEKKAAKQKLADEKKAATAAKKAKGQTPKGRPASPASTLRKPLEIRAAFANLIGDSKLPKALKDFAGVMVDFINNKVQEPKLYGQLALLAGIDRSTVSFPQLGESKATAAKETVKA